MIENKKILILGMARSGYSVAKLLAEKNEIIITDKNDQDSNKINELKNMGVNFIKSEDALDILDNTFDLIIKNPGIHPNHPALVLGREYNIFITNEMEVAFNYLPKDVTIIGVTGSNGKTTTTTILYNLLKNSNLDVTLGGNIGLPLSEIVKSIKNNSILLLEISDHQLYDFKDFKTDISVLTNISETHLDFHGTYDNYKLTKKKIFNNHTKLDKAFINYNDSDSMDIIKNINSTIIYFNDDKNYYDNKSIYINKERIIDLDDIKIKGNHNYENILASLLVLKEFTFDIKIIKEFLKSFGGVEHRLEIVKKDIYNDSKSTNPTSTIIALNTMDKPTHLILGGMERNQNFDELNNVINKVKCIYAIGEVTDRIYEYANKNNLKCIKCYNLETAIKNIKDTIEENEAILLSPASASWDQYDKFETRGEEFKKLVEKYFN